MNHKNKKHDYFLKKYPEFEHSIARFNDYIQRVLHNQKIVETRFLLNIEQMILKEMIGDIITLNFNGGFKNANYQKAILIPKIFNINTLPNVLIMCTHYNCNFNKIEHKDVLGAIMNQGISRNKIGDILIDENMIYVACEKEVVPTLEMMRKIKHTSIQFEIFNEEIDIQFKFETLEKIVSSFRLDTIVSTLTNLSRVKSLDLIQGKFVKVNSIIREEKSYMCEIDDEITIRKYGKFRLNKIKSKTKKENMIIEIDKYI